MKVHTTTYVPQSRRSVRYLKRAAITVMALALFGAALPKHADATAQRVGSAVTNADARFATYGDATTGSEGWTFGTPTAYLGFETRGTVGWFQCGLPATHLTENCG